MTINDLDLFAEVDREPEPEPVEAILIEEKNILPVAADLNAGFRRLMAAKTKYTVAAEALELQSSELIVAGPEGLTAAANIQLLAAKGIREVCAEMEGFVSVAHSIWNSGTAARKEVVDRFNAAAKIAESKGTAFRLEQKKRDDAARAAADLVRKQAARAEKERLEREARMAELKAADDARRIEAAAEKKIQEINRRLIKLDVAGNNTAVEKEAAENSRLEAEAKIKAVASIVEKEKAAVAEAARLKVAELTALKDSVYVPPVIIPEMGAKIEGAAGSMKTEIVLTIAEVYSVLDIAKAVIAGKLPVSVLKADEKKLLEFINETNTAVKGSFNSGYRADGFEIGETVKNTKRVKK